MKRETRAWIEAGNVLARDPAAEVPCPECEKAVLVVTDVRVSTTLERHLHCPRCKARNSLLMRQSPEG